MELRQNLKARVSACHQQFSLPRSRNTGGERDHKTQTSDCVRIVYGRRNFVKLAELAKAPHAIEAVRRIYAIFDAQRQINSLQTDQRLMVRRDRIALLVAA